MLAKTAFELWQERRSRLNHDVLCNRLRTALMSLVGVAEPDPSVIAVVNAWLCRREEYLALLDEAPMILSGASVLEMGCLVGLSSEERAAVLGAAHEVYLLGSPLNERLGQLRECIAALADRIRCFVEAPAAVGSSQVLKSMIELAEVLSLGLSELTGESCDSMGVRN